MYYVITDGFMGVTLFLADRTKNRSRWWVTDRADAMKFHKKSAAEMQASNLYYKNPAVVSGIEAAELENRNFEIEVENDIHPFSDEGHGQW